MFLFWLKSRRVVSKYIVWGLLAVVLTATGCGLKPPEETVILNQVPMAFVTRPISANGAPQFGEPTNITSYSPGGQLLIRFNSTTKSVAYRITQPLTLNDGDVSDPESSFDGKKLVFALRCGINASGLCNGNNTWNIWEYDMTGVDIKNGILRQITDDLVYNDVDPAYLSDGRIVFSSNRQEMSQQVMSNMAVESYPSLDESQGEPASVLHIMAADGSNVEQISFGQSHDRNPVPAADGTILFSRWDHAGSRNKYTIYKVNPDGSNLRVVYGAHTGPANTEVSFLHPRPMQDGSIMSTMMPIMGTNLGGALAIISAGAENNAHTQVTATSIPVTAAYSSGGRITTPYPVWDGSSRTLVSYTPPRTVPGTTVNGTPAYGIRVLDYRDRTLLSLALPDIGSNNQPSEMFIDPVPIMTRPKTPSVPAVDSSNTLAGKRNQLGTLNRGVGIVNIKSVYYTDSLERMGDASLIRGIDFTNAQVGVPDPKIPTTVVNGQTFPNLNWLKSPVLDQPTYLDRPARFIRVLMALPSPPEYSGNVAIASRMHSSIRGAGSSEMQAILGYVEVEPDGSAKFEVPANVPLAVQVVDSEGRAFALHNAWFQVRPGETLRCTGCHTSKSANSFPPTISHNGQVPNELGDPQTMAETRYPFVPLAGDAGAILSPDINFTEFWTAGGIDAPINLGVYSDINPAWIIGNAASPYVVNSDNSYSRIIINFKQHIQPILEARCLSAGCHNSNNGVPPLLDVPNTMPGSGWTLSYRELMNLNVMGDPVGGFPDRINDGTAFGGARGSFISEVLNNMAMRNIGMGAGSPTFPILYNHTNITPPIPPAELRLLNEWLDIGAQYYNEPYLDDALTTGIVGLKELTELRGRNQQ